MRNTAQVTQFSNIFILPCNLQPVLKITIIIYTSYIYRYFGQYHWTAFAYMPHFLLHAAGLHVGTSNNAYKLVGSPTYHAICVSAIKVVGVQCRRQYSNIANTNCPNLYHPARDPS
jgi:hypothetical protein